MRSLFIIGLIVLALLLGGVSAWWITRSSTPTTAGNGPGMTASLEEVSATPTSSVPLAEAERGGQLLDYTMDGDVKVFRLTVSAVRWPILPDVSVVALAYNGQVPGPTIRVVQGDRIRIIVRNQLDEPTTIHWHGLEVPNAMDGVPDVTQRPIGPGEEFSYEFTVTQAGIFMYHSHYEATQATRGLGGVFIIEPKDGDPVQADLDIPLVLQEWGIDPASGEPLGDMPGMPGMSTTNFFTINGKAFPATEPIRVKQGQRVWLRLVNFASEVPHPIHLHGQPFKVIAKDGYPWDGPIAVTQLVGAGETYDLLFTAENPGTWLLHCHVPHHTTNNGEEPGGMMLQIVIEPASG
jgi:FtsP/CotA-like multicopper oxidase with cupredoxin domain